MQTYIEGFLIALKGAPITIGVSLFALLLGITFGLILALMRTSKSKILAIISKIYIEIIRGTPMIVQALIMAYGIPTLLQQNGIFFKWSNLIIPAMIVCGLNSAAYMAEVIRGGIQGVDNGQLEAAQSLGMSKRQINALIILPQAIKIAIPAFGNELVSLIKETAVLSYVGVVETLRSASLWSSATYNVFPAYVGAALVYLLMTFSLSKVVAIMEKKMNQGGES